MTEQDDKPIYTLASIASCAGSALIALALAMVLLFILHSSGWLKW